MCQVELVQWKVVGSNPTQGSEYFSEKGAVLGELNCVLCFVYQNKAEHTMWFEFIMYMYMYICIAGVLYFVLRYFTDKYNIYYVYRPAPFNGRQFLHHSAINFVIVGAVHLQIATLFFSVVRLGKTSVVTLVRHLHS